MYMVLLSNKYFRSYRKITSVFRGFRQTSPKRQLFYDNSKSICPRAKSHIWLRSAFYYAKNEYNIIKIQEKKFPTFRPKSEFSKARAIEKISSLSVEIFFVFSWWQGATNLNCTAFYHKKAFFWDGLYQARDQKKIEVKYDLW